METIVRILAKQKQYVKRWISAAAIALLVFSGMSVSAQSLASAPVPVIVIQSTGADHTGAFTAVKLLSDGVQTQGIGGKIGSQDRIQGKKVYVHITDTGSKYHRKGCRYLRQSDYTITLKKAKQMGYTACKVCLPPK